MNRAGAALSVIASLLGTGEAELLAQCVQQGRPVVERHAMRVAIDLQRERPAATSAGGGAVSASAERTPTAPIASGSMVAVLVRNCRRLNAPACGAAADGACGAAADGCSL